MIRYSSQFAATTIRAARVYLENKRQRVYRVTSDDKRSERALLRINGNVRIDAACLRAENQRSPLDGRLIQCLVVEPLFSTFLPSLISQIRRNFGNDRPRPTASARIVDLSGSGANGAKNAIVSIVATISFNLASVGLASSRRPRKNKLVEVGAGVGVSWCFRFA